eukprot:jgi/Antlo1/1889/60
MSCRKTQPITAHIRYLYSLSFSLLRYPEISRLIIKQLVVIAKKYQLRLSAEIKRSICKVCWSLQVPLVTSDTSIERSISGLGLVSRCRMCGSARRFVLRGEKGLRKPMRAHD